MHEVAPRLFLGNVEDARQQRFGVVVNATPDFPFYGSPTFTLRVPVMDNGLENEALAPYLDGATAFIRDHLGQRRNVLVHCAMGRQRSAAIVAAYLMRERGMRVDDDDFKVGIGLAGEGVEAIGDVGGVVAGGDDD